MMALTAVKKQRSNSLTLLQKIAKKDQTAVAECIETYGNLVWAMARKFTVSSKDAEIAAQEIFIDIWRYAERFNETEIDGQVAITIIARRCLSKRGKNIKNKGEIELNYLTSSEI